MGGKVFSSGATPLRTPRIDPTVYFTLRDQYLEILRRFYRRAGTPLECPEKTDYGDLDLLVTEPYEANVSDSLLEIHMEAVQTARTRGSPTTAFAIAHPLHTNQFIQVDVHVCPSDTYDWQMFHHAHGDLWNLLGTLIRPFGLTANDTGFHVRIEEIEVLNRKRSMIFLTRSPFDVVSFLGLDSNVYKKTYGSVEQLYSSVKDCRFFDAHRYCRQNLKSNDRKRLAQRPIYRHFVEDWIPKNCQCALATDVISLPSRPQVLRECLSTFERWQDYQCRIEHWAQERTSLLIRQKEKASRKRLFTEIEYYADAWVDWLKRNEAQR